MKLRRCRESSLWGELVATFGESLLLHSWDALDLQERVLGVTIDRYIVEQDGRPVGVFPVVRHRPHSLNAPILPFPFLGPLVPTDLLQSVTHALRGAQFRSGLVMSRFDVGPLVSDEWREHLEDAGCAVRDRATVVVDLTPHSSREELEASYARNHRRSIRRARQGGGLVRAAEAGECTRLLPRVLDMVYTRHGRDNPYPPEIGQLVESWAASRKDVGLLTAEVHGEFAGMLVVLGGSPTALSWLGGSLSRFREVGINHMLYHEALAWALERGHPRMDFSGGVLGGVLRFKLGFNGVHRAGLHVQSSLLPRQVLKVARTVRGKARGESANEVSERQLAP